MWLWAQYFINTISSLNRLAVSSRFCFLPNALQRYQSLAAY